MVFQNRLTYAKYGAGIVGMRYSAGLTPRQRTYGTRSYTGTQVINKRKQKMATRNSFHQKLLNEIPCFHFSFADNLVNQSMTHNTIYEYSPTQGIVQGSAVNQRFGDEINLVALKINGIYLSPSAAAYSQLRIIVCYSDKEVSATPSFTSALGSQDIFLPATGITWGPTSITNPKAVTVLDDRTIVVNGFVSGQSEIQNINYTVPLGTKFPYRQEGGTYGKFKNMYIVVIGACQNGVTGTTAAGTVLLSGDLMFKNMK